MSNNATCNLKYKHKISNVDVMCSQFTIKLLMLLSMTEILINATTIVNRGHKLIILVGRYVQIPCVVGSLLRSSKY